MFNMLLSTHSRIPPTLGARPVSKAAQVDMECNILVMREPLISVLLESQPFLRALLHRGNVKEGQQIAWTTCLCSLLKLFPKLPGGLQDFVMEEESSLEVSQSTTSCGVDSSLILVCNYWVEVIPGCQSLCSDWRSDMPAVGCSVHMC